MAFDYNFLAQRLKDFKVKNVRIDEGFETKSKRLRGMEILVPLKGKKLILACTDERPVKAVIDPNIGQEVDRSQMVFVRIAGAAFGVVDAVRNVKVTVRRDEIIAALVENQVLVANHIDTHAKEGRLTGCGYGALRAYAESGSVFDRPPSDLEERLAAFEEMGVWRVILEGDHVADSMVINPYTDKALDPSVPEAEHKFFSLDLGIYRNILHWIEGALQFGEEAMRTMLVKMVRDTMAAVFILSNGEINEAIYIELGDDRDQFYAGVVHEGLGELKEREGPVLHIIEQRMGG